MILFKHPQGTKIYRQLINLKYRYVFIDETQYMKSKELGSLIVALHRVNQLGYPVMDIGAGLPKIYKMLSDEKSYMQYFGRYGQ